RVCWELGTRSNDGGLPATPSYDHVRDVLMTLKGLIGRTSWVERKIHRYIYEHHDILLPDHRRVLFEHPLWDAKTGEVRKADFILAGIAAFPAILVELENPNRALF